MDVASLRSKLIARGIGPNVVIFSNSGPLPEERYCISKEGNFWEVYYYRGSKIAFELFLNEEEACNYLWALLERDKRVW